MACSHLSFRVQPQGQLQSRSIACGRGVICGQPECPPTRLIISHQLRTWYPGGDQALGTGPCEKWTLQGVQKAHLLREH